MRLNRARTQAALLLLLGFGTLLIETGCGSARRSEPIVGPLAMSSTQVAEGRKIFMKNCQRCHIEGEGGLGPAINNKPLPAGLIRFQVRHGLGAMPAFPKERISDAQIDDMVAYLQALRKHDRPTETR